MQQESAETYSEQGGQPSSPSLTRLRAIARKFKVIRVRSDTYCDPLIQKILQKHILDNFAKTAKLCKASDDAYYQLSWMIVNDQNYYFNTKTQIGQYVNNKEF